MGERAVHVRRRSSSRAASLVALITAPSAVRVEEGRRSATGPLTQFPYWDFSAFFFVPNACHLLS